MTITEYDYETDITTSRRLGVERPTVTVTLTETTTTTTRNDDRSTTVTTQPPRVVGAWEYVPGDDEGEAMVINALRRRIWQRVAIKEAMTLLASVESDPERQGEWIKQAARLAAAGATDTQVTAALKVIAKGKATPEELWRLEGRIR